MQYARIPISNRVQWDSIIEKVPHEVYHTWGYAYATSLLNQGEVFLIVVSDGDAVLCAPAVERKIPQRSTFDLISPYGQSGLVSNTKDRNQLNRLLAKWVECLREEGYVSLFMRCNPFVGIDTHVLKKFGEVCHWGSQVCIDTTQPEADMVKNLRRGHAQEIRRLNNSGYVVEVVRGESLDEFVTLYYETMDRLAAGDSYYFSRDFFDAISREVDYCVATVRSPEGEIGAVSLMLYSGDIAQYFLSASSSEHRKIAPTKGTVFALMKYAHEHGIQVLNLGSGLGGEEDSLMLFKRGFGGEETPLDTFHLILNPALYEEYTVSHEETRLFPAYRF